MSFRDRVARDIGKVFLDTRFFAENRTIRYDGEEYPDIAVSIQEPEEIERQQKSDDHAQGFFQVQAVLFCDRSDLGGVQPEQGTWIEISSEENPAFFERYQVGKSSCEMGMLRVDLEATEQ